MKIKSFKARRFDRSTVIAAICGLVCAICLVAYMMQVQGQATAASKEMLEKYGGDQVEVCVATRDISGGETVKDSDLETRMWVANMLPDNAITKRSEVVGKQLGSSVIKGEVFSSNRFISLASSLDVPDDKVAVSVPIDDTAAVGGSINTNQRVDVYATGSTSTTRIGKSVQILETSNSDKSNSAETKWVTLAVDKDKVQEVVSAAQNLQLYIVLPSEKLTSSSSAAGEDYNMGGNDEF